MPSSGSPDNVKSSLTALPKKNHTLPVTFRPNPAVGGHAWQEKCLAARRRRNMDGSRGHKDMDTLGFEPRAFRMRSGCDTTTPCALVYFFNSQRTACFDQKRTGIGAETRIDLSWGSCLARNRWIKSRPRWQRPPEQATRHQSLFIQIRRLPVLPGGRVNRRLLRC